MIFQVKTRIKTESAAQSFALERHGVQDHGRLKIEDHLADVANHVRKNYDPHVNTLEPEELISAAWLHDIIEDTTTTIDEIEDRFGYLVSTVVGLLTDKKGRNRLERHLKTYHMIRSNPDATLVKLCDRRHNQDRSLKHGEHWMVMYSNEYNYFKFALWTPHAFKKLWEELDWQNEEMKKALTW